MTIELKNPAALKKLLRHMLLCLGNIHYSQAEHIAFDNELNAALPEVPTPHKIVLRSYCEGACECPTCHLGIGTEGCTIVEQCAYCQLRWFGYGEYAKSQLGQHPLVVEYKHEKKV